MSTREEVKALWKRCFHDSDAFVDLYFEQRYKDEINVDVRHDGKIVAALQMIPYPMTFCGTIIPTSYVSGACTHPDYRKKGWMRCLLKKAHRRMYQEGKLLSALIPAHDWLFDYYAKEGYAPTFGYVKQCMSLRELHPDLKCVVTDETENRELLSERYCYFSSMMKKRPCCIQHPREDFLLIMEDLRICGGKMLVARKNHRIVGMAFCVMEDGQTVVKELLADHEGVHDSLLLEAAELFRVNDVICLQPSFLDSLYLGMSRVIHAPKVLELIAGKYPGLEMHLHIVEDDTIPENNGYYSLSNGKCFQGYRPDVEYRACTIRDFARLLLTAEHPYMSLMLD